MTKWHPDNPKKLVEYMGQGKLDCQIYKKFNISKETFYEWIRTKSEFKAAYEEGLPLCEAKFLEFALDKMEKGDEKGFKYWIALMNNKFGWAKDREARGTQININTMNVLSNKSDAELLEFINEKLVDNQIIDVQAIELKKDDTESA